MLLGRARGRVKITEGRKGCRKHSVSPSMDPFPSQTKAKNEPEGKASGTKVARESDADGDELGCKQRERHYGELNEDHVRGEIIKGGEEREGSEREN